MAESYSDYFRDGAHVKRGRQNKIELPCPKCKKPKLLQIEILRTAGMYFDKRFAGYDFRCSDCYYKWKETERISRPGVLVKRPGIFINSDVPDIKYTKTIIEETKSLLNSRLKNHDIYSDYEEADYQALRGVWMSEHNVVEEVFIRQMLIASQNGNINENVFDYVWIENWIVFENFRTGQDGFLRTPRPRRYAAERVIDGYIGALNKCPVDLGY